MLILTRRIGETLMIGDDITVTIVGYRRHQVQVGIQAPRDVEVHRQEIYDKMKAEKPEPPSSDPPGREMAKLRNLR